MEPNRRGDGFPLELFEPRPLREDGKGFVEEATDDPAASAYFATQPQSSAPAAIAAADGTEAGAAPTSGHFLTEYGFMGINDVDKGHETEKRSYRDRRSSWTSRDSHGSSTFLSSGSKRGLSDDGDSVGTNEFEPPRRRPSCSSSIGADLDDLRALDLDQDDDFNDDFGVPAITVGEGSSFAGAVPSGEAGGRNRGIAEGAPAGAGSGAGAPDRRRAGGDESNTSDSSLTKALQVLDEVIMVDPAEVPPPSGSMPARSAGA